MLRSIDSYLHLPRRRYFSALEVHAAIIGSIAAVVVLVGYGFDVEPVQSLAPGFPTMKLRTAACLMALSLSYLLSLRTSARAHWGSVAIAATVLGVIVYSLATPHCRWPEIHGRSGLPPGRISASGPALPLCWSSSLRHGSGWWRARLR